MNGSSEPLTKLVVARRQLGTALWLFIENLDPVSVHTLAGAGAELAEHLARDSGGSPFVEHVLSTNPALTRKHFYGLARQYYNAFKHLSGSSNKRRKDDDLLASFRDEQNDALLFIAWSDLGSALGAWPVEVQVFQAWFYALHPEKLARKADANLFASAFPRLSEMTRAEQKERLKAQIGLTRNNQQVMDDVRTDKLPLVMSGSA